MIKMPELPEVETVKKTLKLRLLGKKIKKVRVLYQGIIEYPSVEDFVSQIIDQKIVDMHRRGKWLIFELTDYCLLSHLRMEGKYFFRDSSMEIFPHEHVIFSLSDESELRYMDVRKFGKMWLIPKNKLMEIGPLKDLGLEPWDERLTVSYLQEKFSSRKLPIKTVLLDQSIVVGVGNIYANEVLYLSKIHPLKSANELDVKELESLITNIRIELEMAIKKGGTTIRSYASVDGVHGLFQQELYVHGKEHCQCRNCASEILKIKVGGRGTYYCPVCQKEKSC